MKRIVVITTVWLILMARVFGAVPAQIVAEKPSSASTSSGVDFVRDIQPLLADRCYSCHGPEKQKSGLRLDQKASALAGGDSGKAINPGKSTESLLIKFVSGLDPDKLMPPKGERLTSNQIAALSAWIDAGAHWPEGAALSTLNSQLSTNLHWSFNPPKRPEVPKVKNRRWVRNPMDAFVLAKLESLDITPTFEADRVTLIRRLSLDLLGLPPTPEQVQFFLSDRRDDAYERLVDQLLGSPHFGERWGRHWLDLARYADSEGYQIDTPRPYAYVYRNWVIDAVNRDLPFDLFTIEQLAGDLLPNPTVEQKTATGFHRNTLMNHEDGIDKEEFRCKAKVDRVSTTGTVWLGLTVGCAECHTHKYDPIPQREFYQIYALFNNAEEREIPAPQSTELAKFNGAKRTWEIELANLKETLAQFSTNKDPRLESLKQQVVQHEQRVPKYIEAQAQALLEKTNPPKTHVHIRGDFLRKGEEVQPGALSVLHPFKPRGAKADRLDLARWLVDPANPLTGRVAVNHIWKHLFGRGLVATPEDFGLRGEPPSHPELLDWLTVTFMSAPVHTQAPTSQPAEGKPTPNPSQEGNMAPETAPLLGGAGGGFMDTKQGRKSNGSLHASSGLGWSRKAMIKLIVTSATYRQSSRLRPELLERDPVNVLLARQNRLRLESEIVRDVYLASGGLLNAEIGGPSFRPFMPEDLKALGTAGAFKWEDSEGPSKYRRGMYIFAQRTVPYPVSMTFDQANPSEPCTRRERSNTPLQALTLLNNAIFVECAQGLGRRMLWEKAGPPRQKIEHGFELCFGRKPTKEELARLETLYQDELRLTRKRPEDAAKLLGACASDKADKAETATLVAVGQTMMNLDEFITRE